MAQLHHILGSILRDIAQARVTSDIYSREVSQFYEQDSLLRLFPIPRTEIKEIEIDLKFAISEISIDPDRREDTEGKISGIFEHYSEIITIAFFEKLRISSKIVSFLDAVALVDTPENTSVLKAAIFDYLLGNKKTFLRITENEENQINLTLDKGILFTGLSNLFDSVIYSKMKSVSSTWSKSKINTEINAKINSMNDEVEYLETSEYKAEVIVSNQELQLLPESSISSIKIVTTLKNYVWSQVEEKDGKVIRRLIPE